MTSPELLPNEDRVSFPRWWIKLICDGLFAMGQLPSGELGDWAFTFREQLKDALTRAPSTEGAEAMADTLGWLLDAVKSEVAIPTPLLKRRFASAEKALLAHTTLASETEGGKSVQATSSASERVCDHPVGEKAVADAMNVLLLIEHGCDEAWARHFVNCFNMKCEELARERRVCQQLDERIIRLEAAHSSGQVIAHQENLHGRSPESPASLIAKGEGK